MTPRALRKILLLAIVAAVAMSPEALACSCARHELPDDVAKANTIYFGRLVAVCAIDPSAGDPLGHYEVSFAITEALKGDIVSGKRRELLFLRCAVPLEIGGEYVLFERELGRTTRCWGSAYFDRLDWKADETRKAEIRKEVHRDQTSH
jgi:hypothetical protein